MFKQLSTIALACLFTAGCRNDTTTPPSGNAGGGGTTSGDMATGTGGGGNTDGGTGTVTYTPTTIATMRGGAPGAFELDNVVVLGVTGSSAKPVMYVRDSGTPGDLSAMAVKCDGTTGTHPCSVAAMLHSAMPGQSVTVKGTYIKSGKAGSNLFEEFYLDNANYTAGATGTAPTPVSVMLSDVSRNNSQSSTKYWFQYVTVSNPGTLDVYDLSPAEFVFKGATKCPYQTGFGLIPDGTAGYTAPAACTGTTQPTGLTTAAANAAEILIGTDFYTFLVSSDCACAAMYKDTLVTPTQKATALSGILVPTSIYMSTPPVYYQYVDPVGPSDLSLM